MASTARKLEKIAQERLEGLSLEQIDDLAPWHWVDTDSTEYFGHDLFVAVDVVDDNGEDFTAVFADQSRARWINNERTWVAQ